jgi:hypothetical protein
MINLEELTLFLLVMRVDSTYIDDILIYMSRINKFTFSINAGIIIENIKIDFISNEDIQSRDRQNCTAPSRADAHAYVRCIQASFSRTN